MNLHSIGGFAAYVCAGTYLFGFALLVTVMAPLGFGTSDVSATMVVSFISANQGIMILWHTVIYILNALALAVLVVALSTQLQGVSGLWAPVSLGFGLMWSTLVLGAGMIANVTVERVALLADSAPEQAEHLWEVLHAVELGLGGGNEIAGAVWIGTVSLGAWRGGIFGRLSAGLGVLVGLAGISTMIPALGDLAGAVFGLGAIVWFIAVGSLLIWSAPRTMVG